MRISVDVRKGDANDRDNLITDLEEMGWDLCDFSGSMVDTFEFVFTGDKLDLQDLDYTIALGFPGVHYKVIESE